MQSVGSDLLVGSEVVVGTAGANVNISSNIGPNWWNLKFVIILKFRNYFTTHLAAVKMMYLLRIVPPQLSKIFPAM